MSNVYPLLNDVRRALRGAFMLGVFVGWFGALTVFVLIVLLVLRS